MNNNKKLNRGTRITYKDNIKILKYYKINIPKSKTTIKKKLIKFSQASYVDVLKN